MRLRGYRGRQAEQAPIPLSSANPPAAGGQLRVYENRLWSRRHYGGDGSNAGFESDLYGPSQPAVSLLPPVTTRQLALVGNTSHPLKSGK
jgi:hypothetical protein